MFGNSKRFLLDLCFYVLLVMSSGAVQVGVLPFVNCCSKHLGEVIVVQCFLETSWHGQPIYRMYDKN